MIKITYLYIGILCIVNSTALIANSDAILNSYHDEESVLNKELKKAKVWDLLKKEPQKADEAALVIFHKVYDDDLYEAFSNDDYVKAWDKIKAEIAAETLQRLPSKRPGRFPREKEKDRFAAVSKEK